MALAPLVGMTVASVSCGVALRLVMDDGRAVVFGALGPLAAALATWVVVARTHAHAPARVSGAMVALFGVKMVLYPVYVVTVVLLLDVRNTAFVVSFTAQIVLLYGLEAFYLRRLFAGVH